MSTTRAPPVYDNLLKPDLARPATRSSARPATSGSSLSWDYLASNQFRAVVTPL